MITAQGLNKLGFKTFEDFVLQDDGDGVYISSWLSSEAQPSISAITTAHNEWQAEYDALEYARKRQAEYPTVAELTISLFDVADKAALVTKRAAVKTKWPKDNSGPIE